MAKFAFFNVPLHAHINPTLPVVQELVARGHEVTYYLTEKYRGPIEATGAKFYGYESKIEQSSSNFQGHSQSLRVPILMVGDSLFVLPQILENVREEQPDCIVYDPFCFSARFIAQMLDIPAVMSRVTFVAHAHTRNFFRSKEVDQEDAKLFQSFMKELSAHYPIQPFNIKDIFLYNEALNLVFIPRSFQIEGEAFGDEYHFVGPSIGARCEASDFPLDQLSGQPIIYITLGTVYNNSPIFFKTCFAALADLPYQVIVATGRPLDQLGLGSIPHNFLIRSYVPQLEVMEHADVFIGSGSMTSLMEAISQGVPMVLIPQAVAQESSARRVAALGMGIVLEKASLNAEGLRNAVVHVVNDPTFHRRVQHMQEDARASGGFLEAADTLLQYISVSATSRI
jgi:MGT family glycosyltransferase